MVLGKNPPLNVLGILFRERESKAPDILAIVVLTRGEGM